MPRNSDLRPEADRGLTSSIPDVVEVVRVYRSFFEHSSDAFALLGIPAARSAAIETALMLRANPSLERLTGRAAKEIQGRPLGEIFAAADNEPLLETIRRVVLDGETATTEYFAAPLDRYLRVSAFVVDERLVAMALVDVTDHRRVMLDLRRRTAYFDQLFERSPLGIVLLDNEDRIVESNRGFEELFGFSKAACRGKLVNALIVGAGGAAEASMLSSRVLDGEVVSSEQVRYHMEGHPVDVRILAHPIHLDEQQIGIYGIYIDISHRKRDPVTALPNRASFQHLLENELVHAAARGRGLTAVLVVSLLGLRDFTDAYGGRAGNALLKAVADRLRNRLEERHSTVPARVGSNRFAVLQIDLVDVGSAAGLARRLLAEFESPFQVAGQTVRIGATIGVVLAYPDSSPKLLVNQAERASQQAEAESPNSFQFHTSDMDDTVRSRMQMGQRLYGAQQRGELSLDYQLQVELNADDSGVHRICGVEGLLRWRDADGQVVAGPGDFIPVAEATGQIVEIGEWVLRAACTEASHWLHEMGLRIPVAVNLSPVQFKDRGLVDKVRAALDESGLPHDLLELEITESLLMEATPDIQAKLQELAKMGISFALDDFGKGYSSWGYLRREDLPLSKIKVDKSILEEIETRPRDAALLSAVSMLGRKLGVKVCAEGIERSSQIEILLAERCDQAQGYLLSRPIGAEELRRRLHEGTVCPGASAGASCR